jgi:apolipoprotein N-acyltransferase
LAGNRFAPYLLATLSGVILSFAYAPVSLWFAAPLAFALLIYAIKLRQQFFPLITLFAIFFNAIALSWSNKYVGVAPWLALVLLQVIFYLPLVFLKRLGEYWYFYLPFVFLALEELRARFPFGGFGWLRIGFSQADSPYIRLASVGGVSLLSLATLLLGVGSYLLALRSVGLLLPAIAISLSILGLLLPPNSSPRQTFQVLAVQGSVPKLGLDFNARATEVFQRHIAESKIAIKNSQIKADLIIWPENSVDVDPYKNREVGNQLQELADQSDLPILIGAVLRKNSQLRNASILWRPKTGPDTTYIKRHLTPFGEFMPLRKALTLFSDLPNQIEDFTAGSDLVIHRVGQAKIAPVICFELVDDRLVQLAAKESNLFAVQTNSATFANTSESAQQLAITRVRSIEHAKYSVSVSTVGISAIIDSNGVILKSTSENIAANISSAIALNENRTLYDKTGSYSWLLVLLIALAFGVALQRIAPSVSPKE